MNFVLTNLYFFLIAFVLAVMEIQIEGKNAWATALPTQKPKEGSLVVKIGSLLFGGKTFFTGYHLALNFLIILFLLLPFFFDYPLTLENFLKSLSLYFMLTVRWDFLWIVLNPHFGLSKMGTQIFGGLKDGQDQSRLTIFMEQLSLEFFYYLY